MSGGAEKAYIGVRACGCVTFVMIPSHAGKREERADLKRVMRSGRRIEIVSVDDARARLTFDCPHGDVVPDAVIDGEAERLMQEVRNA